MGVEKDRIGTLSLGCSGLAGNVAHRDQGRQRSEADPHGTFPSSNHFELWVGHRAVNLSDETALELGLDHVAGLAVDAQGGPHIPPGGITELGQCYEQGNTPPLQAGGIRMARDGKTALAQRSFSFVAARVAVFSALASVTQPARIKGLIGDIPSEVTPVGVGGKVALTLGGPRAVGFHGDHEPPTFGWEAMMPTSLWLQWMLNAPGRKCPQIYADYKIGVADFRYWLKSLALASGLLGGSQHADSSACKAAYQQPFPLEYTGLTTNEREACLAFILSRGQEGLAEILRLSVGWSFRFGIQAIMSGDGDMGVYSHPTSGPKQPAPVIFRHADTVTVLSPDDWSPAQTGDGVGSIEESSDGQSIRGVAESAKSDRRVLTPWIRRSSVTRHLEMPPKYDDGLALGEYDPAEDQEPPPPEDEFRAKLKRERVNDDTFDLTNLSPPGAPKDRLEIKHAGVVIHDQDLKVGKTKRYTLPAGVDVAWAVLTARRGDQQDKHKRKLKRQVV